MANDLEQRARELLAAEYVRSGASERTARVSSESPNNDSAIRAIVAALQQKVTTPALPEVTDEDEAEAWDVLLITGQPIDSCACDGDMRKVLESYRARLMAKAVQS